jgi:MYXO-CTERM domain-containing protein
MKMSRLVARAVLLVTVALVPVTLTAGPIFFSGQFDPMLGEVRLRGGDGLFDSSGAPLSVTLYGSDSGTGRPILTTVGWDVTSADPDLRFLWRYQTWDVSGPRFDPAGYFRGIPNGSGGWTWFLTQLSRNNGPSTQSGWVRGISINPGERFGFYVWTRNDEGGRASLTIYTPEPATAALGGLGLGALALLAARRRRAKSASA